MLRKPASMPQVLAGFFVAGFKSYSRGGNCGKLSAFVFKSVVMKAAYFPVLADDAPLEYAEFWHLWRAEKFFECHEVLEDLWREERGVRRVFYNGLIHGAVAIYQHRRGNAIGACRQMMRARWKLELVPCKYLQVDCGEFLRCVEVEIASSLTQIDDAERACWPALQAATQSRMRRVLKDNEN